MAKPLSEDGAPAKRVTISLPPRDADDLSRLAEHRTGGNASKLLRELIRRLVAESTVHPDREAA